MTKQAPNPALIAAQEAQLKVDVCIDTNDSFRLEAGAGAGKTYSLISALKRIISTRGTTLLQAGQKVACITYTETARDEIAREIEEHPAILVETIHAFSWMFLSPFQKSLRLLVEELIDRNDKIVEGGGVGVKPIEYNLGYFGVDQNRITLAHDDVPLFMAKLLSKTKYRKLLAKQFPVIFIDEYQDTDKHFMAALSEYFFKTKEGPLVGLFGDHWQTIYRGEFELADFELTAINKGANFRSEPAIVDVLNKLRPELIQAASKPRSLGEARFFYANSYVGERTNTSQSKGDVPADIAREFREALLQRLQSEGWDIHDTKVLMLTHNALAADQGYPLIPQIFTHKEAFIKKEDPTIRFFADIVEPLTASYSAGKYGEMFKILGKLPSINKHSDKASWRESIDTLNQIRQGGNVGDVIDHLQQTKRPQLPDKIRTFEDELKLLEGKPIPDESTSLIRYHKLRSVPYKQIIELVKFIEGNTPFATQHSVKGAEFENVLVILGGGWNHYNWPQLLELLQTKNINSKNEKGYYRARNLFYVAISRPMKRLAVLATQTMSDTALAGATQLFGADNVISLTL